jgi:hypothetical protein
MNKVVAGRLVGNGKSAERKRKACHNGRQLSPARQ